MSYKYGGLILPTLSVLFLVVYFILLKQKLVYFPEIAKLDINSLKNYFHSQDLENILYVWELDDYRN